MVERRRDGRSPGCTLKVGRLVPLQLGGSAGMGILWFGVPSGPARVSQVLVLSGMLEYVGLTLGWQLRRKKPSCCMGRATMMAVDAEQQIDPENDLQPGNDLRGWNDGNFGDGRASLAIHARFVGCGDDCINAM